jgi:hypothetical protein
LYTHYNYYVMLDKNFGMLSATYALNIATVLDCNLKLW